MSLTLSLSYVEMWFWFQQVNLIMIWWLLVEALEDWHVQKKVGVIYTIEFLFLFLQLLGMIFLCISLIGLIKMSFGVFDAWLFFCLQLPS